MMMGPEPMSRIFLRSVRRGILRVGYLLEEIGHAGLLHPMRGAGAYQEGGCRACPRLKRQRSAGHQRFADASASDCYDSRFFAVHFLCIDPLPIVSETFETSARRL